MLCALALVAFFALLVPHLPDRPNLARLALVLSAAGAAIDLFCDAIYITVLPGVGQEPALFLVVERLATAGGVIVANGLYSLGTLLMSLALRSRPEVARSIIGLGYGVFGFGMLLSASGFAGSTWLAMTATGPTIGLFCIWVVMVARTLDSGSGS
jgi:hypothetical protein